MSPSYIQEKLQLRTLVCFLLLDFHNFIPLPFCLFVSFFPYVSITSLQWTVRLLFRGVTRGWAGVLVPNSFTLRAILFFAYHTLNPGNDPAVIVHFLLTVGRRGFAKISKKISPDKLCCTLYSFALLNQNVIINKV